MSILAHLPTCPPTLLRPLLYILAIEVINYFNNTMGEEIKKHATYVMIKMKIK